MKKERESEVRYYSRMFPDVFIKAEGATVFTESGRTLLDFFAGAGSLNYGHNHPAILNAVVEHLLSKRLINALDMKTPIRTRFMERFDEVILRPRNMNFKFQFPGPTGTNAVEAAIKLARKVTSRKNIFAFFGGFHGMTLGSLSVTSNLRVRPAAGIELPGVTFMPYPHGFMSTFDSINYMEKVLEDSHSGIEKPAAVIVETVQAEGGVIVAPVEWLTRLRELCSRHNILLICDDIQVGCGRTGRFFSTEHSGIVPDIIVLAKSISGLGLPLSLVLLREDLDVWKPGEHTGTFRSNALSLAGATAALELWADQRFEYLIAQKEKIMAKFLTRTFEKTTPLITIRGLGMIWGVCMEGPAGTDLAEKIARRCYEQGLLVERAGRNSEVIKLMPPLTIETDELKKGLEILKQAVFQEL